MDWEEWIELDNHYPTYHAAKAKRIAERGERCCRTAPEAQGAAMELLEELGGYLSERYPSMFQRGEDGGVRNCWSGEVTDLDRLSEDPMQAAARLVQDDLAIMMEAPDGQYYLKAGAILLAGFWRLEDKWGMPLSEIRMFLRFSF